MDTYFTKKQEEAIDFFQQNMEELSRNPLYKLKYLIIYNNKISGVFDTFPSALTEAVSKYPQDEFIIQQVIPEEEVVSFLYSAI